ncbi:5-hydroxytryptamine receptor 2B [Exaiptasia diaphana]|nr:5-hydroxytryptamine receptor 2B [Exaiptasia diaphana]
MMNEIDKAQSTALIVINTFLALTGSFGNFLIIFAVLKTPQLRQRPSNHLLLSLAVADLVVTIVSQPVFITQTALITFKDRCIIPLEITLFTATMFSCTSSALHLAAVSIDRVISAVKPHRHREIMKKWYKMMLVICWGTGILPASLRVIFPEVQTTLISNALLSVVVDNAGGS